jgi:hypothetical protein
LRLLAQESQYAEISRLWYFDWIKFVEKITGATMSADKSESSAASAFPNYFELFQNIASPFMAGGGNNPASNAAAMMMATLDPKEIERKTRELETVLMWLKAQVGVVEMSIKTLEYQKTFLAQMAATPAASGAGSTEKVDAPDLAELAKTAAAMNPALWAWNLLQQPTAPANADAPIVKPAARPTTKRKRN